MIHIWELESPKGFDDSSFFEFYSYDKEDFYSEKKEIVKCWNVLNMDRHEALYLIIRFLKKLSKEEILI